VTELVITAEDSAPYRADPDLRWLANTVDTWRTRDEQPRFDPGWFHPSDLQCDDDELLRRYLGTSAGERFTAQKLRIFDNGHGVDQRWKHYLEACGLSTVKAEEERAIELAYLKLRGHCDDIVAEPETGMRWVVELKSINPIGFGKLKDAPQEAHVQQIHCYMVGLGIMRGCVLYENKGDQTVKVFAVPYDPAVWHAIEGRLLRLRKQAEARGNALLDGKPASVLAVAQALKDEVQPDLHVVPSNRIHPTEEGRRQAWALE